MSNHKWLVDRILSSTATSPLTEEVSRDGLTTQTDNFYWQFSTYKTTDDASNGCTGADCITGAAAEQNYLYQTIQTIPFVAIYKLTFTYDGGAGGVNELKVLAGRHVVDDIVNVAQGANTYTVYFIADRFDTKLNFLGRQDNGFSFLTDISVTAVFPSGYQKVRRAVMQ